MANSSTTYSFSFSEESRKNCRRMYVRIGLSCNRCNEKFKCWTEMPDVLKVTWTIANSGPDKYKG